MTKKGKKKPLSLPPVKDSLKASASSRTGDRFNMSGDFRGSLLNINSTLEQVNQTIDSFSGIDQRIKDELVQLLKQLGAELQSVTQENREEAEVVAASAKSLLEVATNEKPNKTLVKISAEGLKKAAENLARVNPKIFVIALQIVNSVFMILGIS